MDIDLGIIRMLDFIKNKTEQDDARCFYYYSRRFQFNPLDMCHEDDYLIFITGRPESQHDLTVRWRDKYFPNAGLVFVNHGSKDSYAQGIPIVDWIKQQALIKADAINKANLDVYFEDTPTIVKELRKLCPNTKIIQYGGRIIG